MRKKLLLALVGIVLACCLGATVSAFAGITTNSPVGDGMLSNGELNATNFMIMDDEEDSYVVQKGNTTYQLKDIGWRNALIVPMKKIPKADLVDGAKVTLQFDVYSFGAMWTQSAYFAPFTTAEGWGGNYLAMRINVDGPHFLTNPTGNAQIAVGDGKPSDLIIAEQTKNAGFQGDVLTTQQDAGRMYATFWFEYDITEKSMTIYAGNAEAGEKKLYSVMTNAFVLPDADGYYMNFAFDNSAEIDNYKIYRTLDGQETVYADFDFEDQTKILSTGSAAPEDQDKLVIQLGSDTGTTAFKTYDNSIIVTNPGQDARIVTLNPLKVDTSMAETFRMTAAFRLQQIAATRKVGIAFGLNSYSAALSAPAEGASFLYLSVDAEGNVVLGADNIASDGTATAAGTVQTLAEVNLGDIVSLSIVGKQDNSIDVTVNENTFNFPGLKLSGNIAFAQTGTGDVTYAIMPDEFNVTGYAFVENEATEAVTTNFDGNYLSSVKFSMQSKVAPSEYIKKQEGTTHEISGLVVEDQKLGFYGTSTNTRVMFQQQYADFVLQFDYISEPFAHRAMPGGLETAGAANRYSPLYILFGADNNMPELAQTYALGIIEGNATQYFWGAESLVTREGKLGNGSVKVLATLAEVEQSEEAVPWYTLTDGQVELSKYGMPNEEDSNYVYSFYNKTSRVKMVVVNNSMALYAAEVDESGNAGEYVKLYEQKVSNAAGYVGFGTDAPGWATLDNIAITPIARETALSLGLEADPAVDLAADVDPADMDTDPEPTPIAKAELTVDKEGKKVTWKAVTGAKEYEVTVKLNNEEKLSTTVTGTEVDLSSLTEAGEYEVAVVVVPEDEAIYLRSRATVKYTVESGTGGGDDNPVNPGGDEDKGCGSSIAAVGGLLAAAALGGAAIFLKKRKENE